MVSETKLFVDSTPLLDDPAALRERGAEEGYLFFKGLLPRRDVLDLRAEMLAVVRQHGWLQADQDDLGGTLDRAVLDQVPDEEMRDDIGVTLQCYQDTQRLERFHALPHHPRLVSLYRKLFGREVLVHPRHIARMITGHRVMRPTPPHQDFAHIQGSGETWTCWLPIGDCPRSLGGLTVLRGSHRHGYLPVQPARGAGNLAVRLCPWENEWVSGDYEAGDVLTFPSYTVHKALRSAHPDLIRLSLDMRYQPIEEPVDENSLIPHCGLGWEDIYQNWESREFQYYWRGKKLQVTTWDPKYHQPGRRIC